VRVGREDVGVSDESVSVSWNAGFKRQHTHVETKQTQVTRSRQDDDTFGRVYCSVRRFVYRKTKGGGVGRASMGLGGTSALRLQITGDLPLTLWTHFDKRTTNVAEGFHNGMNSRFGICPIRH